MEHEEAIYTMALLLDRIRNANDTNEELEDDIQLIISSICNVTKKQHKNTKASYRARKRVFECCKLQEISCIEALDIYYQCFKEEINKKEELTTNDSLFYTIGA